ncbi:MAG: extracellular solute-binding protein [Christensenellales bacterium]
MKKGLVLVLCFILSLSITVGLAEDKMVQWVFTKGGFEPLSEENSIHQAIEEKSGITFEHIAPPSANYAEKVSVILSGKDLPDAIRIPRTAEMYDYAEQGMLLALDDYLPNYPNLVNAIPQRAWDIMRGADGKIYGIPVWTSEHRYNFIIRGDWLDKLGLKNPTTLDELHDVYAAFVSQDPDGNGNADTYGLMGTGLETFEPIFGAFGVMGVHRGYFYKDADGTLKPQAINPKAKEALKLLQDWYKEGLIHPEWITIRAESELNERGMKNQFGSTHRWWTWEPKIEAEMRKIDESVEWRRIAPPIGPEGMSGVRGVGIVNFPIVILSTTEKAEELLQLFDWYHTEEGMMTAYSGVKDLHWEKRADGTFHTLPQFNVDAKWIQWYSCFENEQPLLAMETYLVQSRRDALNWSIVTNAADGIVTEAEKLYSADLNLLVEEVYGQIITGNADIETFDDFVKEYNRLGGEEWTVEVNAKK